MGWEFAGRSRRILHDLGHVYCCGPIVLEMVPNAQKHLEVADLYEKLSADENASIEWRIAFARKANWHRILARMSAEREHPVIKEKLLTESRLYDLKPHYFHQPDYGTRAIRLS